MGAFFLFHNKSDIYESNVNDLYLKKGFKNPLSIEIGDFRLLLFRKQLVDIKNYYQKGPNYIFACGSLFYKGYSYRQSLKQLLIDYLNSCIDPQKLFGNYVIIFYNSISKEIVFCIDPAFVKNVYFDPVHRIITTDFLALLDALPKRYSLNKIAIVENLTTGHLISPDTYANEIYKVDKVNVFDLESYFPGLKLKIFIPPVVEKIDSYEDAVKHANDQLSNYFESVKNLAEEFGAHIGLTGGFDSRLLLMHARRHLKKIIVNSFWRPNSVDYINAKELAKVAGFDFYSFEEKPFVLPEKKDMLMKAYYFFDGQIRSQNNWDEEFNMPEYAAQLASNHLVGFHGCGGEQYRNSDRMVKEIRFDTYIKYEWMYKQCPNVFKDKELQAAAFENIKKKIRRLINIPGSKVSLLELKRIQNEIWNSANRTTRVNVLNQQQFYFAPFTEYQLSQSAYKYVPYLGKSLSFQIDMMKRLDSVLSRVKTNYGFSISDGEPLKFKLIPYFFNMIPRSVFYKFYLKVKRRQKNHFQLDDFINEANIYFRKLGEKIVLEKLGNNKNLGSSLTSFNFLLNKMNLSYETDE